MRDLCLGLENSGAQFLVLSTIQLYQDRPRLEAVSMGMYRPGKFRGMLFELWVLRLRCAETHEVYFTLRCFRTRDIRVLLLKRIWTAISSIVCRL